MKAREVMTTEPRTVSPDQPVGDVLRAMGQAHLQAFPVVDAAGKLCGLLSILTVLRHVLPSYIIKGDLPDVRFAPDLNQVQERLAGLREKPVSAVMDRDVPTVRPDTPLLECGALVLQAPNMPHLLPVVEADGRLAGVIAPWDLVKQISAASKP
jgi:CBS domain-containing protein